MMTREQMDVFVTLPSSEMGIGQEEVEAQSEENVEGWDECEEWRVGRKDGDGPMN